MPEVSTPGIAATRSIMRWKMAVAMSAGFLRGLATFLVVDLDGCGVIGLEAEIDGEDLEKLRSSNPALTRSMQARAISVTTRAARRR